MEGKIIQLPFGVVSQNNPENESQFNFPPNFRKDTLFEKLPYLTHAKNPALNNIIKNGIVDNLELQKYLLATGLLQDSIQQSLDMIVTDGSFNNAFVRRVLDAKYPSIMKKPNPIDVVFKDKAKFDVQNPVIGFLVAQVQENKKNEKEILNQMSRAPSTKDVCIIERLAKSKNDNNDDDDNFPLPLPPLSTLLGFFSSRGRAKSDDDDDNDKDRNLTPTQRFLFNQPQQERIAIAVGESGATTSTLLQVKPCKVKFSEKLNKVFPKTNDMFESDYQPSILEKEEITVPNVQTMVKELND